MNKIAKIAVVASIALAFTACGEDKKKAEAEAAAKKAEAEAAAQKAEAEKAEAEKAAAEKAVQDSIAKAAEEARVKDSIAAADSIAKAGKKGTKTAPKAPVAEAPVAAPQTEAVKAASNKLKDKLKK